MRVEVVPDQHDRGMQLLVRGGDQAGVIVLGQTLALALTPTVHADEVEQPTPPGGLEADQAGHRRGTRLQMRLMTSGPSSCSAYWRVARVCRDPARRSTLRTRRSCCCPRQRARRATA